MSIEPILPDLLPVPGGRFWMGDDSGRADERPGHSVDLKSFFAARLPVTNAEYACFLLTTGHEPPPYWADPAFNDPAQPVVAVTWFDATDYCAWLSAQKGREYRLPTEAEWERAATGGVEGGSFPWGPELPLVDGIPLAHLRQTAPRPVGTTPANGYGLVDIGFNVHEWCVDWYDPTYYARSPRYDPRGPDSGERRASRGGAWRHQMKVSRCAARSSLNPQFRYNDYGFRVFTDL